MARRGIGTLLGALLALALVPAAAHAEGVTVPDPRGDDAPRGLDVVSARYDNTGRRIGGVVRVASLGDVGVAAIGIQTSDGSDLTYFTIRIRHRRDGAEVARVRYADRDSVERVPCRLRGGWDRGDDRVRLRVSVRCLRREGYRQELDLDYMNYQAITFRRRADTAADRFVDRN